MTTPIFPVAGQTPPDLNLALHARLVSQNLVKASTRDSAMAALKQLRKTPQQSG